MSEAAPTPQAGGQGTVTSTGAALAVAPVAPAPTGAQSTSQAVSPPPPPPATPPATPNWLEGADETTIGYVQNKGWTEPKQVLEGYRNLEKLLGADKAGNAVVIPKADAKPEEWTAVFDRLGRPSAPDGYKVQMPEGGDKTMHEASLSKFHELGLTKTQGETLANWYNGLVIEAQKAAETQRAEQFQADDAAVRREWGAAYNQNLAQAQAAARGLGLDAATIDKISDAIGHKGTMALLQKLGSRMGEDTFETGDPTTTFGAALTPAQAKAQIQTLMTDKDFTAKYLKGDADAKAKMAQLHNYAYPES